MTVTQWTVFVPDGVKRVVKRLPKDLRRRLGSAMRDLAQDPHGSQCTQLVGSPFWRRRVGDWRIIYDIQSARLTILIVRVAHRREVYDH